MAWGWGVQGWMDGCGGGPVKGVPVDSHEHVCVRQERVGELEALHVFEPRFRHGSNPELVQRANTENRCVKLTLGSCFYRAILIVSV